VGRERNSGQIYHFLLLLFQRLNAFFKNQQEHCYIISIEVLQIVIT
jgi:hypothetical protein